MPRQKRSREDEQHISDTKMNTFYKYLSSEMCFFTRELVEL
jgi:hypothetical protein